MADIKVAMISSTIKNLGEHREKVLGACIRLKVMPSMMEHWPSSDIDGIRASLQKVDEADIYIGIFAHRYGYVPEGDSISVTEMEYNRAVERGIPRLIFLMHEDHDIKISQVEMDSWRKLDELKQRLKKDNVVSFFQNADDLSAQLIHSLSALNHPQGSSAEALPKLGTAITSSFDPNNYVFFVPFRSKGNQVLGRDEALRTVRLQLIAGRRTAIGQTASFQGLGGLGKTQLAVEYAYAFRDQYPNGIIFLNADQDIEAQLINIAEKAKWVAPESDHKDKLSIATQRLRTRSHCLIIFDNLDQAKRIKTYLPDPDAEPHILVTSRFDLPEFVPIPIELLDTKLSLQLLTQEAGQTPSTQEERLAAEEISTKLAGLPLALELAGAYLRHRPIGWLRYRDLLNENLKGAFPSAILASFTRHESDLYSTLKISDEIFVSEPILKGILDILTWSGSSAMGQSLLFHLLEVRPGDGAAALALGVSLRLIQNTPKTDRYALHRLVREVRREDIPLSKDMDWVVKISKKLASWFQALKRKFSDLSQFEAEIDHLSAWQNNISEVSPKLSSRLLWLQAYPPFHRGSFHDSYLLLKRANALLRETGDEDLDLNAEQLSDLCTICTCLGQFAEGAKCGNEALAIRLQLFGEHHSETAMTFHNLAANLRALSETNRDSEGLQACLNYELKAFEIWESLHGEDHIDTALALDGISQIYRALGKNGEAIQYAERAFSIREKVLGFLNPDTISSLSSLGRIYSLLGQHSLALEYAERGKKYVEQLFGTRSSWRATLLNDIGVIHFRLKNFAKSLESELDSLALRKELFGNNYQAIAVSVSNIVNCYMEMQRAPNALRFLEESLKSIPSNDPNYESLKGRLRELKLNFPRPGFRQLPRRPR